MKKIVPTIILVLLWIVSSVAAAPLKVGDKAADFKLKDTTGKEWSLASSDCKGKVVLINAAPPTADAIKPNSFLSEAVDKDKTIDKINKYMSLVVVFSPSTFAKMMLGRAHKKTGNVYLIDNGSVMVKLWGLDEKSSNMIVLDKDRVCRYIFKGTVPNEKYNEVIEMIKTYQPR